LNLLTPWRQQAAIFGFSFAADGIQLQSGSDRGSQKGELL
jgi:hypothetical protein